MFSPQIIFHTLALIAATNCYPFLYKSAPAALTSLVASASSSQPPNNIADLRSRKTAQLEKQQLDNDDFFTENEDMNMNEAAPSLLQKKVNKIITKLRFISQLTQGNNAKDDEEDDFQKEIDAFNREYETDVVNQGKSENVTGSSPVIVDLHPNESQLNKFTVDAQSLGVYFMELIGSIFGLAYGAAAQHNNSRVSPISLAL